MAGRRVLWAEHVGASPEHMKGFWEAWDKLDASTQRRYLVEAKVSQRARKLMMSARNPLTCRMDMRDVIEETRYDSRTGRRRPIMQRVAIAYAQRRRCRRK
jgi:hypothetical protein